MSHSRSPDIAISERCSELGLWPDHAHQIARSLKLPVTQVVGLDPATLEPLPEAPWLWLATFAVSVDLEDRLPRETLLDALAGRPVPFEFTEHIRRFLDDLPLHIVVMAVAQASQLLGMTVLQIWEGIEVLTFTTGCGQRLKVTR